MILVKSEVISFCNILNFKYVLLVPIAFTIIFNIMPLIWEMVFFKEPILLSTNLHTGF